jgi:hypothetical protein
MTVTKAVELEWLKVWAALANAEGDIPMTALTAKEVENIQLDSNTQLYLAHAISAVFDLESTSLRQSAKTQSKFDILVDLDSALDHAG